MQAKRIHSADLSIEKLPDGSTAIYNAANKTVYSLNASAAAAWEACGDTTSLAQIVGKMQRSFNPGVTEEVALEALRQLEEKGLVETMAPPPGPTRRSMVATAGAIAPLVLALTFAEQRAFALGVGSGTTTTTTLSL